MNMKHDFKRQRTDPVLAPDQFSVAQQLGPEDLDGCVMRHGVYPSFLPQLEFHGVSTYGCRGIGQGQSHPLLRP